MSSRCNSLHNSADSDGPCAILSPQDPLARSPRTSPLSTSLDDVIKGVSNLLRPTSPMPRVGAAPTVQILPAAAAVSTLPTLAVFNSLDCAQLLQRINLISPPTISSFGERMVRCSTALKFENIKKNRYDNVYPANLGLVPFSQPERYINASYFHDKKMIVMQGPLKSTLEDFWLMLYEQQVSHLISLTNYKEGDKEKTHPFWVPIDNSLLFSTKIGEMPLTVQVISSPCKIATPAEGCPQTLTKEVILISFGDKKVVMQHWHVHDWFDHTACSPSILVSLIEQLLAEKLTGKCAMHCSAGWGRAPTFAILLRAVLQYLDTKIKPTEPDISSSIVQLRQSRPGAVMYPEQLKLIFDGLDLFCQKNRLE